jgi:hypothetical protein
MRFLEKHFNYPFPFQPVRDDSRRNLTSRIDAACSGIVRSIREIDETEIIHDALAISRIVFAE